MLKVKSALFLQCFKQHRFLQRKINCKMCYTWLDIKYEMNSDSAVKRQ